MSVAERVAAERGEQLPAEKEKEETGEDNQRDRAARMTRGRGGMTGGGGGREWGEEGSEVPPVVGYHVRLDACR